MINPTLAAGSLLFGVLLSLGAVPCSWSWAQEHSALTELENIPGLNGSKLFRQANSLYIQPETTEESGEVLVPRIAAPIRNVNWQNGLKADKLPATDSGELIVTPDPEIWSVRWSARPSGASMIQIEFDAPPLLMHELAPIAVSADGSFWLPAHLATTNGEKIRYEPQSFKNTVGYWVGKQDQATWTFELTQAGRFNVAILQGCGEGQGGSQAQIEFRPITGDRHAPGAATGASTNAKAQEEIEANVEFEVLETGHFQNFQWRHLADVELQKPGKYEVRVSPLKIKNAALMDIRAIHLIRLPE